MYKATIFDRRDQMKCEVNMKLYQRELVLRVTNSEGKQGPAKTLFLQILTSPLPTPFLLVHLLEAFLNLNNPI